MKDNYDIGAIPAGSKVRHNVRVVGSAFAVAVEFPNGHVGIVSADTMQGLELMADAMADIRTRAGL